MQTRKMVELTAIFNNVELQDMNNSIQTKTRLLSALLAMSLVGLLAGCSDDEAKNEGANKPAMAKTQKSHNPNPFDHSDDMKITSAQKEKFEDEFTEQCVARELKNSANPDIDKDRVKGPCECIAKFMTRDLTGEEAEKFLDEHQNAHSLEIKYQNAAYHCLQATTHPKGPQFTKPAQ
ncbi:MAG: hypothetical protein WC782_07055 [Methylococcaceae bacterium]|jgi:hypothetical protein